MNLLQIIGFGLITIGTIISFIGSYRQSKNDTVFQSNVSSYVQKQAKSEIPVLKALRVKNNNIKTASIIVKNVGKETAKEVKLIYNDNSVPDIFSSNPIYKLTEISQGVEVEIPLNLFWSINVISSVPNTDESYKKNLLIEVEKFNKGEKAFIPKFHLEYIHEDSIIKSENYSLIVDIKSGIYGFTSK